MPAPTKQKESTTDERLEALEAEVTALREELHIMRRTLPNVVKKVFDNYIKDLTNLRDDTIAKLRQLREFMNSIRGAK